MKEKILITGAAGYIGAFLCSELSHSGYLITAVDLMPLLNSSITKVQGDACDPRLMKELVSQADIIIPLAAVVGAPPCERNSEAAKYSNLEAVQLLNSLRSKNQLVIFPMTNNGYRPFAGEVFATEESAFETDSLYTRTKFQAEQELLASGNAVSLRLASVFGVSPSMRWDLLVHDFVFQAHGLGGISLYEGDFKRNFVHLQDVADCFKHILSNPDPIKNQIFNLALDAGNITKRELAFEIKKVIPHLRLEEGPHGQDPDGRDFYIATEKLKRAGFQANHSLDQGIRDILGFLQKNSVTARGAAV